MNPSDLHSLERLKNPSLDWDSHRLLMMFRPSRMLSPRRIGVPAIRRIWQLNIKAFATRESVAAAEDHIIARKGYSLRLRVYRPRAASDTLQPAVLWIHGGGFIAGDLYSAGATCRALANRSGCVFVAVEYRLAPESSLHESLDDCIAAFQWLASKARALGLDSRRLVVGGDSAGGTLAALVTEACCKRGGRRPIGQLLVYPSTDVAAQHRPPLPKDEWRMLLTGDLLDHCSELISRKTDLSDASLSPIRVADPAALPPTILLTVGFDPLRDEGLAYGRRLRESGVPVRLLHYPGQFHGFLCFDGVIANSRHALNELGESLRILCESGQIAPEATSLGARWSVAGSLYGLGPVRRWKQASALYLFIREGAARGVRTLSSR